ncbi:hypothetical protein F5Y15DRAFT_229772 [Xylariaceae sp. FL0016]|nr:hypothetical protein F5Y15DRAFT_229772 [Xylariaceae sp. FL0016]
MLMLARSHQTRRWRCRIPHGDVQCVFWDAASKPLLPNLHFRHASAVRNDLTLKAYDIVRTLAQVMGWRRWGRVTLLPCCIQMAKINPGLQRSTSASKSQGRQRSVGGRAWQIGLPEWVMLGIVGAYAERRRKMTGSTAVQRAHDAQPPGPPVEPSLPSTAASPPDSPRSRKLQPAPANSFPSMRPLLRATPSLLAAARRTSANHSSSQRLALPPNHFPLAFCPSASRVGHTIANSAAQGAFRCTPICPSHWSARPEMPPK